MKLCLINNLFGEQARGGAEKIIKLLAETLVSRGHEVVVICGANCSTIKITYLNKIKVFTVPSKYETLAGKSLFYRFIFHWFSFFNVMAARRLSQIIKQEEVDLVWTNNLVGLSLLSFKFLGPVKLVHTFHDIQLLHPSGLMMYQRENVLTSLPAKVYQALIKFVFPKKVLAIFPSQWLKSVYEQNNFLPENNLVLPNPVKTEIASNSILAHDKFTFLYLGQLESHKGIELLIKTFLLLENKNSQLLIAGQGKLETNLRKKYSADNLKFLGQVAKPELVMSMADCLVVPSLCYENLPTVILEALNNNLAVIGSKLGGIKDMLSEEQLLFTPIEDDLVRILNWCLTNQVALKQLTQQVKQKIKLITVDDYLLRVGEKLKITF